MFLGFINANLSNNRKLLSRNNLSFLGGKIYPSSFLKNRTPTPIPYVKWNAKHEWDFNGILVTFK